MKKLVVFLIMTTLLGACDGKEIRYSKEFNLRFLVYKGPDTLRFNVVDTVEGPGETLSSYSRVWKRSVNRKIGVLDPQSPKFYWHDVFEVPPGYNEEIIEFKYRVIESYYVNWFSGERYD